MSTGPTRRPDDLAAARRTLVVLPVAFAVSGCAALIYEVVWFQLLSLRLGASAASLGVLVATFLGGLCLGGLLLPRLVAVDRQPLRVYAAIELGIGVLGLLVLYAAPLLGSAYLSWAGGGVAGLALRLMVAACCLLPSTLLMGATLPAVASAARATRSGAAWLGVLYAANTVGAVVGALAAGFYLLRVHDVSIATFVAVALNLGAAAVAAALPARERASAPAAPAPPGSARLSGPVYAVTALSGFTALTAEVLWTRHLSLLIGSTVYAFALILAVFLAGLAGGAAAGAALGRRMDPRTALACCQLLLCPAVAWSAYTIARSLPYWPLDVTIATPASVMLELDVLRAAWAVLPAALLWGASFPLALAAVIPTAMDGGSAAIAGRTLRPTAMDGGSAAIAGRTLRPTAMDGGSAANAGRDLRPAADPRRVVGLLYAANTAGAIAGALLTTFVLVVSIGSRAAEQLAVLIAAAAGVLLLARAERALRSGARVAALAAAVAAALVLAYLVPALPPQFVAYGRFLPTRGKDANVVYVGEGLTASIAVTLEPSGLLTYHNQGKTQASTYPQDLRLQRMLGHLATLVPEKPSSVLVIALGAGITAGAVSLDPAVERVVVAEIEPLVPHVAAEYFAGANFGVVTNPKVEIRIDDGRHVLASSREKFDAITSDPLDPWVKGAAALYTREFWQLCKSRLNDGGVVTVFLQLYESTGDAVKSEIATFFEAFPNGAVFANTVNGEGYDAVLVARADGRPIDIAQIARRLDTAAYAPVAESLRAIRFESALDLLGTYAADARDLRGWLADAQINTDANLRLQYLGGEGLNVYRSGEIYRELIAQGASFPDALFAGTPPQLETLRQRFEARGERISAGRGERGQGRGARSAQ
ncbi:MAG TPA: fused MFS/spermidine synthase [Gammaproteobacteria bacterium]|nr:fused MFS/spermidine synthase [Gammaproteobacteria bacterium]